MSLLRPYLRPGDRIRLALLAFTLLIVACGSPAGGANETTPGAGTTATVTERVQLVTNVSVNYYPVFGNSSQEIFDFLNTRGPVSAEGERAVGLATAKPRREWKPRSESSSCSIESMTITVDISLTLPRLDPSSRLNVTTMRNWQRFAAEVERHERRHVEIYVEGFEEMKTMMAAIPPKETCTALEAEIRRIWDTQLRIINERQERFHDEEDERVERLREPIRRQIEANQAQMDDLNATIAMLEAALVLLGTRLDEMSRYLDGLKRQLDAIVARYPSLVLPEPAFSEYQTLQRQYNSLVDEYNALVRQHELTARERQAAINEHNRLASQTAQLVEDFNWIQ